MYCPNCKKEILDNSKFCKYCGTEIKSFQNEQKLQNDYIFCKYCGKKNAVGSVFCSYCGKRIGGDGSKSQAIADEKARIAREQAEAKARAEEEARIAREQAEAKAKAEEEARIAKEQAEAKAKAEEEARIAREQAEAKAKAEEEARIAREQAEAKARAEEEARIAKEQAEAKARAEEEARISNESTIAALTDNLINEEQIEPSNEVVDSSDFEEIVKEKQPKQKSKKKWFILIVIVLITLIVLFVCFSSELLKTQTAKNVFKHLHSEDGSKCKYGEFITCNDGTHKRICEYCGHEEISDCVYPNDEYIPCEDGTHKQICQDCGYEGITECSFTVTDSDVYYENKNICSNCGNSYTSLKDGYILAEDIKVGDKIFFGSYEQDIDPSNGKEPISWDVMENDNGKLILFSTYVLDTHVYNDIHKRISWEDCSLRKWLNNEFYNEAFSEEEKKFIIEEERENPSNDIYNNFTKEPRRLFEKTITAEKVTIPSVADVMHYYDSNFEYFYLKDPSVLQKQYKKTELTDYALAKPSSRASGTPWFIVREGGERLSFTSVQCYDSPVFTEHPTAGTFDVTSINNAEDGVLPEITVEFNENDVIRLAKNTATENGKAFDVPCEGKVMYMDVELRQPKAYNFNPNLKDAVEVIDLTYSFDGDDTMVFHVKINAFCSGGVAMWQYEKDNYYSGFDFKKGINEFDFSLNYKSDVLSSRVYSIRFFGYEENYGYNTFIFNSKQFRQVT